MYSLVLSLAACGSGLECGTGTVEKDGACVAPDTDAETDADTDTDADADSDADSDADADADSDADSDADADGDSDADTDSDTDTDPAVDRDGDGYGDDVDCDDNDASVNPGATEECDPADTDEDCDGVADDDDPSATGTTLWYLDNDGDGYGTGASTRTVCDQPAGYAAAAGDCDDTDASIGPEGTWYEDIDGDGYGNASVTSSGCAADDGFVAVAGDCNDVNAYVSPGATETCDGDDNDCDGAIDDDDDDVDLSTGTTWCADDDGDGWASPDDTVVACDVPSRHLDCALADDCDDGTSAVSPSETEICSNGIDDDCDPDNGACALDATTPADADAQYLGSSGDFSTASIALLDADGNGDLDLLIGATNATNGRYATGEVVLHTDNPTGTIDKADAFAVIVGGTSSAWDDSYYGYALAAAGDMDGDGDDDWLTSATDYDSDAGVAYLYDGGSSAPTSPTASQSGSADFDSCGVALAGTTDVTGDGALDWIVGCSGIAGGRVYVLDGGSDVEISAATGNDAFGYAVATDDFNGDGVGDLVATSPNVYDAYLYLGPVSSGSYTAVDDDSYSGSTYLGYDAVALGDLDADGYPELMVSRATYGSAELFYGDGSGTLLSAGRVSLGRTAACAAGGDFDGDGNRDLAIGDWSDDSNQGIVRVALGPISGAPTFTLTIESATQEEFGYSIAAGDLDGDSIDDLVVGAPYNADGGTAAGAAFVFHGIGF